MSLFGPADDDKRRRWQQRNLKALTELIQLGASKTLTPLFWTLPDIGNITGKVDAYDRSHDPREVFEAWFAALSKHRGVSPRGFGLRGEGPSRSDRTDKYGQTRLMAAFTLQLPEGKCNVTLVAVWFAEDLEKADA